MPQRLVRFVFTLALICTALVMPSPGTAVAEPSTEVLEEALRFRRDFGLNTDVSTVRDLIANPAAYGSWPVALTQAEEGEMDRRLEMEREMDALEAAAEKLPNFAGHWIDQVGGGDIVVAFTADPEAARPALNSLLPPKAVLRLIEVSFSLAELRVLEERIQGDAKQLRADGVAIAHLGVDISENRVKIGVIGFDSAKETDLRARYGDAIRVVPANPSTTACTGRESCFGPPLRAGISAAPEGTSLANRCSLAFLIHAGSAVGWLTAGHCAKTTSPGTTSPCPASYCWNHAGQDGWEIGRIRKTCWPLCNYSDAARGGELNSTYSDNKVWQNYLGEMRSVGSSQGFNADDEGDMTCLNARKRSGSWSCGYIDHIGRMWYYGTPEGDVYFDDQRFATFANASGDSGGAVHSNSNPVVAFGVESGCTYLVNGVCQGFGVYSHIYRVLQEIGQGTAVSVCSTANPCP